MSVTTFKVDTSSMTGTSLFQRKLSLIKRYFQTPLVELAPRDLGKGDCVLYRDASTELTAKWKVLCKVCVCVCFCGWGIFSNHWPSFKKKKTKTENKQCSENEISPCWVRCVIFQAVLKTSLNTLLI
jgi:hypothetical protein